jgi:hypothetical protein
MNKPVAPKPIILYDHLPGILAIFPAVLFTVLAVFSMPYHRVLNEDQAKKLTAAATEFPEATKNLVTEFINSKAAFFDSHLMFWIALTVMVVWYIAYRFNLPKSKFLLVFGLAGTFVGIPVVLELAGIIRPFGWLSTQLGMLKPTVNTGAWIALALVFWIMFLINLVYSWTHMKVRIDEAGLTLYRLGGKGERFELIGLKTENEPLDYLELFLAGVGSLTLKTRMDKPIFTMKRVVCLYRIPWFPFFRGKLSRIEELLNYQNEAGSESSNVRRDRIDMASQDEAQRNEDDFGDLGDSSKEKEIS